MILTCPGCAARFVIPRSEDELRDVEVIHPACGHAFAPFAEPSAVVDAAAPEPVALASEEPVGDEDAPSAPFEEPSFEAERCADHDVCDVQDKAPVEIDTRRLRKELTRATTIPFRHLIPKLAAGGFASAAAAELLFLFDNGANGALPAAHYTLALLGMGR